ncbi:MAG: hypothetical protein ACM3JG_20870 [Thiohalocapsa sp.]
MSSAAGRSTVVAAAVAAVALIGVGGLVAGLWWQLGDVEISAAGWAAMIFGVLLTLAVGVGLMALVFISARRGFDEPGERR